MALFAKHMRYELSNLHKRCCSAVRAKPLVVFASELLMVDNGDFTCPAETVLISLKS